MTHFWPQGRRLFRRQQPLAARLALWLVLASSVTGSAFVALRFA